MDPECIIAALIGAGVAWLATWLYYKKAADELKQVASELQRLTGLALHGLEDAGIMEITRDASGKPMGIIVKGRARLAGEGRMSATAEVLQSGSPNRDAARGGDINTTENRS